MCEVIEIGGKRPGSGIDRRYRASPLPTLGRGAQQDWESVGVVVERIVKRLQR